jgi:hypothetical protein
MNVDNKSYLVVSPGIFALNEDMGRSEHFRQRKLKQAWFKLAAWKTFLNFHCKVIL